ncbi:MAG: thioredoxin family protein [Bacteroidales bacterium]
MTFKHLFPANLYTAKRIGALFIVAVCFAITPVNSLHAEIKWNSYETGMNKISEENLKGFLHFYTDWCTYCKKMNQETFSDDSVADYLNQNFVPIRINAEKQREVAKKYGVSRFPNNWFISEDSSDIGSQPGFIPPDALLKMLQYINTDSFEDMSFQEFMETSQ